MTLERGAYRGFRAKPRGFSPIAHNFLDANRISPDARHALTAAEQGWRTRYVGVTTNGRRVENLYPLRAGSWAGAEATDAARTLLGLLDPADRAAAVAAVDAPQWRLWTNAIPTWTPTVGVLLESLRLDQRAAALELLRGSLSPAGYAEVRAAMKLNAALGELIDDFDDTLTEFMYQLTIFGEPDPGRPWGWQLMGHHLDLHCLMIEGQMVLAPVFIGAEPTEGTGRYTGVRLFAEHQRTALNLRASLSARQEASAVLGYSLRHVDLPAELRNRHIGRQRAGAGQDNAVIAYEGITADRLSTGQNELLDRILSLYVQRMPEAPGVAKWQQISEHRDELRFAWRGGSRDGEPFYYRIHSPVLLIEFDHHAGAFLNNEDPQPFHVHTIVREPNGNDYGKDLLRQHYEHHHARPAASELDSAERL